MHRNLYLDERDRYSRLLLPAPFHEPAVRNGRAGPQVDDEIQVNVEMGVDPLVPGGQHVQLLAVELVLAPGVLQETEPVVLDGPLDYLNFAAGSLFQQLEPRSWKTLLGGNNNVSGCYCTL